MRIAVTNRMFRRLK